MAYFLTIFIILILLALFAAFLIGKWQDKKTRDVIKFWNEIDKINK